jgi:peptide deformylase
MAILKIARMGNPVLARVAEAVADPTAPDIAKLVADMIETLRDAQGLGLAAPQVHVPKRVVIFHVPDDRTDDDESPLELMVLINPVIERLGPDGVDAWEDGWEGCLSVPGLRGIVPRYRRIAYGGVGLDGRPIRRQASGMHARVVQHECDHLDGILYPQRMTDLGQLAFTTELHHRLSPEETASVAAEQ